MLSEITGMSPEVFEAARASGLSVCDKAQSTFNRQVANFAGAVTAPHLARIEVLEGSIKTAMAEADKYKEGCLRMGSHWQRFVLAMQAAIIEKEIGRGDGAALGWIQNTLRGPGMYPDIYEAEAAGGAQKWFDAQCAKEDARVASFNLPHPDTVLLTASVAEIDRLRIEVAELRQVRDSMRPSARLLAALSEGHKPTAADLQELAYALHTASVDLPEFQWMPRTFEEVGDSLVVAGNSVTFYGVGQ